MITLLGLGGLGRKMYLDVQLKQESRQVNFLKQNEAKLTRSAKSQYAQVKAVHYNWKSVKSAEVGNGLPQGGGKALYLEGYVNGKSNNEIALYFNLDGNNLPNISTMTVSSLAIEDKYYE